MFLNTFQPSRDPSTGWNLALAGTAGAGRMGPPTSTRISARPKRVQRHVSPMNMLQGWVAQHHSYGNAYSSNRAGLAGLMAPMTMLQGWIPIVLAGHSAGWTFHWLDLHISPANPARLLLYTHYHKNACSRVCARNYHSDAHLILALGTFREPTVWGFITSKYSSACMTLVGLRTATL